MPTEGAGAKVGRGELKGKGKGEREGGEDEKVFSNYFNS